MHSVRFTAFLLFVLFLPFLAKQVDSRWEPYPAVLLPTGTMTLSDTVNQLGFVFSELYSLDSDGRWKKADPLRFLQPMPHLYWEYIVGSGFNHSFDSDVSIPLAAALERDRWLKQNLKREGMNAIKIKIVKVVLFVSPGSGEQAQKKVLYERIIHI